MQNSFIKTMFLAVLIAVFSFGTDSLCNAQSTKKKDAALELIIASTSRQLPMDYGNGMVNTKIAKEGDYLVYYYSCDESIYDIDVMNKNIPLMKSDILNEVNSNNYLLSELRKACKEAGCGIAYYYVGKTSGKTAKILIPLKELK